MASGQVVVDWICDCGSCCHKLNILYPFKNGDEGIAMDQGDG